jgi:secreted PhoX family phosphatase
MIKNIRIGNIEFRENQGGEIVEWFPNPYYGKENEYKWEHYLEEGDDI